MPVTDRVVKSTNFFRFTTKKICVSYCKVVTGSLCMKEMLYEVQCLKSNEDVVLALAGQFKQLSQEPEKFR